MEVIKQNRFTLAFKDKAIESSYKEYYNNSIKKPLRFGLIISILSWYSGISLVYIIIPDHFQWLGTFTFFYIGSLFGFIIYATFKTNLLNYYHRLGALSNAWAGLYAIYFCDFFPKGDVLILPVLIFIVFFGLYMVRLRWILAFFAVLSYTVAYHIYITLYSDLTTDQALFNIFVSWMTLVFVIFAGRVSESNSRLSFVQRKIIHEQSVVIEKEKELLLKEVHHRVQNNLQLIVSLINLQISKLKNKENSDLLKDTQSRIISMSLVHQRMKQTSNFSQIGLKDFTEELIDNLASLYSNKSIDFEIEISDSILVNIEKAISLGIIINEIGVNYFKHCSGIEDGKFKIYGTLSNNTVLLKYTDNGIGFPGNISVPNENFLGLELIDDLTQQLDGEFKFYNDNGAVYEVRFPLN